MLAVLLVLLAQASVPCSACSTAGKDVRLCVPHAEEERSAFTRAGKRLSSKDTAERIAALEELAALTRAHANAPSRRVAERLILALDDDSFVVRRRATELLGPPQNALVAMGGLLDAFRSTEAEHVRLVKEVEKLHAKQLGSPRPRASQLADLERDEKAAGARSESLLEWRAALLDELTRFPDDRVVATILDLAPRGLASGCNEALLQLGGRSACTAVVESFRVWEDELVAQEKMVPVLESSLAGEDKLLAEALRKALQEELEKKRTEGKAHQPELIRLVEARGLGPAPEESDHPYAAWQRWLEAHLDALPEHLPGVNSPAW